MADTKILLFGGTGQTGTEIARLLLDRGDNVTAVARPTSQSSELQALGASILEADVFDEKSLSDVVASAHCDSAICTIGNRPGADRKVDFDGVRNVVNACTAGGVSRFLLITSIGCGDSRPALSERALKFLGDMCARKTQGEDHLRATGMDWTIIRPGGLSSDPATGQAILTEDPLESGGIRRADVARLTVHFLDDPGSIGKIFSAVDPSLAQQ